MGNTNIIINCATYEQIEQYQKNREEFRKRALKDPDKQKPKNVTVRVRNGMYGLCPTCNHLLMASMDTCDECFQKIVFE